MKVKHLYAAFFLFAVLLVSGQEYPVKFLDITQGLSNNSVNAIYQDKSGYMWIGTYDGLNRYDGYEFKVYKNEIGNKNSLAANYIFSIAGDAHNNIWTGGTNGGSIFNPLTHSFTSLKLKNGSVIKDGITLIKQVNDTLMLAGCEKTGLVFFENNSFHGTPILLYHKGARVEKYHVTAIQPVKDKNYCWVFIKNYGLYKFMMNTGTFVMVSAAKKQANVLQLDKSGALWIGTDDGLYKLNADGKVFSLNILPHKISVTSILADKKDELYVATDGDGVYHLNANRDIRPYSGKDRQWLLKSAAVWSLYEDAAGNKWFGTLRGGVSMEASSERFFRHVKCDGNNPSDNYVLSFCEDRAGNVWIGTDGAGLRYWDRKKNTFNHITTADGLSSNFIPGVTLDYTNNLWVATWYGGINRIDPVTRRIKKYTLYNPFAKREEQNIWFIYEDHEKKLWASSIREGSLYLYNREKDSFEIVNPKLSELLCITETADGTLWTGNYAELCEVNTTTGQFLSQKIGYPIRCILEGTGSDLWVGTSEGGLLRYNRKTRNYKRYTVKEGLPGNTVLRLLHDKKGNLWLSTYNGLSMYDAEKDAFRNFSVSDGLQSNQFSYNGGLALRSGELLFGGINGFNVFDPEKIKKDNRIAKPLLADVFVNNSSVLVKTGYFKPNISGTKTLTLPYDQTTVSLDFIALDYENADKINYAYSLDGWDEHWNFVGKNRKANYARLQEGTYFFKVKCTDSYGKWNSAVTLLKISVLPPWYRTWWAYVLYVLITVSIIYTYLRYNKYKERMRYEVKLAHMESIKEKELVEKQVSMFTYISHEFRTPLSLIINPLKDVIKQFSDKGESVPELAVAHRNARRLLRLIDQLLLFRKAESDADELVLSAVNMNALCQEVYRCFLQQAKEQRINYLFKAPDKEIQVIGDFDKIEISVYNLLSNAFKYTPQGGTISLDLSEEDTTVTVKVTDTGCGISKEDVRHIFEKFRQVNLKNSPGKGFGIGLFVVKYFIEMHKGNIICHSEPGAGTVFTVNYLKGYDHFADLPVAPVSAKMSELVRELLTDDVPEVPAVPKLIPDAGHYKLNEELVTDKKTLLIIDDNAEIRNYLISLFSADYVVLSAENGTDGFKMVKKHLPDVVVSDVAMDGMTGIELCKKIKDSDGLSHILVILLTATTSQETQLQGISDGADDYMTKPFDNQILKAKVETLLRNRSQLRTYFLDNITLKEHTNKVPAEYRDFLNRCIAVIEENLNNENFTIKQFSKEMGMSHNGLYTKIKAISGQTLNGFIRSVKLRRAAVLMLTEDIQIAQAASQVGFEDKKHFREQFVKLFGMTPSEYIKRYRHSFNKELNIIQK